MGYSILLLNMLLFVCLFRFSTICAMDSDGSVQEHKSETTHQAWTISMHAFSDLTHVSPVVFLYLLKECYIHGTIFSSLSTFRAVSTTYFMHDIYSVPQNICNTFLIRRSHKNCNTSFLSNFCGVK